MPIKFYVIKTIIATALLRRMAMEHSEKCFGISKATPRTPRKVTHRVSHQEQKIMRPVLRKVLAIRLVILRTTFFMFLFCAQKAHKNSISTNLFLA